jgi:hypothetical protein
MHACVKISYHYCVLSFCTDHNAMRTADEEILAIPDIKLDAAAADKVARKPRRASIIGQLFQHSAAAPAPEPNTAGTAGASEDLPARIKLKRSTPATYEV